MKITLDTRFNIGDTIYAADHYHDGFYTSRQPYIITDIIININNRDIRTMYCTEQEGHTERFPESWVFDTYEECIKWCEEQNEDL